MAGGPGRSSSRECKIIQHKQRFKDNIADSFVKCNNKTDYFLAGPDRQAGMERKAK